MMSRSLRGAFSAMALCLCLIQGLAGQVETARARGEEQRVKVEYPPGRVQIVLRGTAEEPVPLAEAVAELPPDQGRALALLRCGSAEDVPVIHTGGSSLVARCETGLFAWVPEEDEWRELAPQLDEDEFIQGLEIDPEQPGHITLTGSSRFVTEDYGLTWTMEEPVELAPKTGESLRAVKSPALTFSRCFSISPGSLLVGSGFSSQSLGVKILRSGCGGWRSELVARPNEPNILVITGGFSAAASGRVSFQVLANSSSSMRSQGIRIITQFGSIAIPVTQQGNSGSSRKCSYTFQPKQLNFSRGFAKGEFSVRTATGCSWRVVQPSSGFVLVTGGFSGSGNGRVAVQASYNTGRARVETIRVETPSGTFPLYVKQAGSI